MAKAEGKIRERKALLDELPILERVPCKGIGEYAGCPFIMRAVAIRDREAALSTELKTLMETVEALREESARQLTIMGERDARRRQISTTKSRRSPRSGVRRSTRSGRGSAKMREWLSWGWSRRS